MLSQGDMTLSDEMDLLAEQVKMLAGEIAFNTSTLKRLVEQSVNDPDAYKPQVSLSLFLILYLLFWYDGIFFVWLIPTSVFLREVGAI